MKIKDNSKNVLAEADRLIKAKLTQAALLVERTAKQLCPVRTGTLKRSITHKVERRKAVVGSNVEYAAICEMGCKPHIIRPKVAKALHFKVAGKDVFTKEIHHPGWSGKPYLRPSLHQNTERIKQLFGAK